MLKSSEWYYIRAKQPSENDQHESSPLYYSKTFKAKGVPITKKQLYVADSGNSICKQKVTGRDYFCNFYCYSLKTKHSINIVVILKTPQAKHKPIEKIGFYYIVFYFYKHILMWMILLACTSAQGFCQKADVHFTAQPFTRSTRNKYGTILSGFLGSILSMHNSTNHILVHGSLEKSTGWKLFQM